MTLREKLNGISAKPRVEAFAWEGAEGLFIRVLSGSDRDWVLKDKDVAAGKILIRCLCESDGRRLYEDDDLDKIMALPSDFYDAAVAAACKLNKLTKADREEAEKNSEAASVGTGSDSPPVSE